MDEHDEVARGMLEAFGEWLLLEERDLVHYSAQRFVCNEMPNEAFAIRDSIADALFRIAHDAAQDHAMRKKLEEMGSDMAGSW
jgi:hypothetical protein